MFRIFTVSEKHVLSLLISHSSVLDNFDQHNFHALTFSRPRRYEPSWNLCSIAITACKGNDVIEKSVSYTRFVHLSKKKRSEAKLLEPCLTEFPSKCAALTSDGSFISRRGNVINPNMPSELVHPYQLDEFISSLRGVWCTFFRFIFFFFFFCSKNSCQQTVETQIRRRVLRRLIWVCTVCLGPMYAKCCTCLTVRKPLEVLVVMYW